MNATQKLQYLYNIKGGDAKRFYLNVVMPNFNTYNQAIDLIRQEYNSVVRQNRVKNVLNQLRLQEKLGDNQDEREAPAKLYKIITKLSLQVPPSHRGNAHKIQFLRNAVVGCEWATEPLSRIATHNLSFQQLYGELNPPTN